MSNADPVEAVLGTMEGFSRLSATTSHSEVIDRMAAALEADHPEKAHDIAFHLSDWIADAAFLVSLHLQPDAFTDEDIRDRIEALLIHAPAHVVAAATLAEHEVADVFEVGARITPTGE
jgi:hypothetical protein